MVFICDAYFCSGVFRRETWGDGAGSMKNLFENLNRTIDKYSQEATAEAVTITRLASRIITSLKRASMLRKQTTKLRRKLWLKNAELHSLREKYSLVVSAAAQKNNQRPSEGA